MIDKAEYRAKAVAEMGEAAVVMAERAGVPVPFFSIHGRITGLNGTVQVEAQFPDEPDQLVMDKLSNSMSEAIGHKIIGNDLRISVVWDPYQWAGHTR